MDHSRYSMLKKNHCFESRVLSDSWEEEAFAKDAAGALGGCIWPPRSYTCSFCRREFRSAQALGGHMNVHRRDRARLKQNSAQAVESTDSCRLQNPNLVCNPNFDFDHGSTSPFTSPLAQQQQTSALVMLPWPKLDASDKFHMKDLESNSTLSKDNTRRLVTNLSKHHIRKRNYDQEIIFSHRKDEIDCLSFMKRRRMDDATQCFFPKDGLSMDGDEEKSKLVYERSPTSTLENLDLELRLGDGP